ncbi:MAG: hypothetical protein EKK48_12130 [Candidatus Melainabacteria bacterium]|nr:MAG: hypothetical protein EKK48_12130 [Candidatus Melainabacteria bacterium]
MDSEVKSICRIIDRVGAWVVLALTTRQGVKIGDLDPRVYASIIVESDRKEERKAGAEYGDE